MHGRILILCLILAALNCSAATWYVSDAGSGNGSGSDVNNCYSRTAWVNSQQYTAPGDVVTMVGTNAQTMEIYSDGTATQPITVNFYPGAKFSTTNGQFWTIPHRQYIVIDGGTNNTIFENTATGTGLTWQDNKVFIDLSSSSNITVKNIIFKGQYVHTATNDAAAGGGGGCIYSSFWMGTNYIMNCVFTDACWCIDSQSTANAGELVVSNNSFYRYDHGIVPNNFPQIAILNNHFDTTSNWDTTINAYHHDGIHYYGGTTIPQSYVIAGNIFTGDWGANNTAHIFNETGPGNLQIYNNLFIVWPGNYLNDGCVTAGGTNELVANNTFIGNGTANSSALSTSSYTNTIVNNLFTGFNAYIATGLGNAITLSNNLYANEASGGDGWSSFSSWTNTYGEVNSSYTSASSGVVNSDGTIPSGSPAIGAGANLSAFYIADYAGTTRSVPWTIGAYAAAAAGAPPVPQYMGTWN